VEENAGAAGDAGDRQAAVADEVIGRWDASSQLQADSRARDLRQNGFEGRALPVARYEDGNIVMIEPLMAGSSARLRAARGRSDPRPLKDSRIKVSFASKIPLNVRDLSSAGARKNRCRQRNAVVGWTPHSLAVLAKLLPLIIAWAWSSHFSFLRRCAIGVLVKALNVRREAL
jgi:hypothetical protein